MTTEDIKALIETEKYDFLRTDRHLKGRTILLGLGGSYAYGTNTETSDIDLRGCAFNSKEEILSGENFDHFEQFVNEATDTTIYSFNKLVSLLSNCNPNTIEILGLKPEHYLFVLPVGQELLDSKDMFLSKRAVHTFGGYANQQLYRLKQKTAEGYSQAELEEHILRTLERVRTGFSDKYRELTPENFLRLYTATTDREGFEKEIFMDVRLSGYPLRDYCDMWEELKNICKSYNKIGKRNENAILHDKIGKHSMHLIRLLYMCLDILEKGEIITYREKEHDLLMDIRNGKYLDESGRPIAEFFEMVDDLERKVDYAAKNTFLPEKPDFRRIQEFVMSVNERIVRNN